MPTYTVHSVGDPREWSSQKFGGRFLAYPVDLKDESGHLHMGVEWSRKVESDAPKVGDQIAGDIQNGQHGDKFKMDYEATKELGGSSGGGSPRPSGGSKREWKPESQFDPEKTARITRSHAQKVAVDLVARMSNFEKAGDKRIKEVLQDWINWFELDVEEAAAQRAATGAGVASTGNGSKGVGSPHNSPGPAQSPPEDDIPF